jgi:hypothetical protein
MQKEFKMSILGEKTFFLGLQVSQLDKGIFISHTKYIKEMLKKCQRGGNIKVSCSIKCVKGSTMRFFIRHL